MNTPAEASGPHLFTKQLRIKLCPLDVKTIIVSSSHSYKQINPQRFLINARKGDEISISMKVVLNPGLLECVINTLEVKSQDKLSVEYGLRLSSGEESVESGTKKMSLSNVELREGGDGPYNLVVKIDDDIEPGNYLVMLHSWLNITGIGVEIKGVTEYSLLLNIE